MKIFSVTAFTFLMHSVSLTMGISASRTRNGMGPAESGLEISKDIFMELFLALTFAHVPVASDRTALARRMTDTTCRQANQTDAISQLRLAVQLEQRNVIVQRLAIVVMVYISGGHAQRLGAGTAIFACQIVITHTYIDRIAGANNAARVSKGKSKEY